MIAWVRRPCASLNAWTLAGSLRSLGVQLHAAGIGARLRHLDQDGAFLLGVALHRLDEVGNQVGAALIVGLQVAPLGVDLLLGGGDAVEAATGEAATRRAVQANQVGEARSSMVPPS